VSVLSKKLLSLLENQGFSHDALKRVVRECQGAIERNPAGEDTSDHVMLYVIEDFCSRTASWMEAIQPITTTQHAIIQAAIAPSLKAAIATASEPLSCDEEMSRIAMLLKAGREGRRAQ
jgi:hypothetical protein